MLATQRLLVSCRLFIIVLANLVPTELLVREGRGHGNVTSLFLQVKRIICVREVLLHIDQVVTDGRNWSTLVHDACGGGSWKNPGLLICIAKGFPLILKDLTRNDAGAIVVRPHHILLPTALHMLFIQLCNGVHQGGIIGMGAGAEIGVGTIEIILGLLLTLQDVLLHGVLQQGLDLIQECGQVGSTTALLLLGTSHIKN
mmetsp:Transcript_58187/g.127228  ORF Transcript_58187/g.127228 Transcript_58187/m.127228 type:complete len:200 (-) Transcript_58187:226-825(-)